MKKTLVWLSLAAFLALPAAAASITVVTPAAGTHWTIGSHQFITWTYSGIADSKKIMISLFQNGAKVGTIADQLTAGTAGHGSYEWPSGATIEVAAPAGSGYSVRVKTADGTAVGNSGLFTLDPKPSLKLNNLQPTFNPLTLNQGIQVKNIQSISVTNPKAGDAVDPLSPTAIVWTKLGAQDANVSIALLRNGSVAATIVASTVNGGMYSWDPTSLAPDPGPYSIRVRTLNGGAEGVSGVFTIKEGGGITLLSPKGGEVWESGTTHTVSWSRTGNIQNLTVLVDRNGNAYQTLATGLSAKLLSKDFVFVQAAGDANAACYTLLLNSGVSMTAQSGCFTLTGNPDLAVLGASVSPSFIDIGTNVTITLSIKNQGAVASHPCQGTVAFNGVVQGTFGIPAIGVGQTQAVDAYWKYTGHGTIVITVNSDGANIEPDKTNNSWTKTF